MTPLEKYLKSLLHPDQDEEIIESKNLVESDLEDKCIPEEIFKSVKTEQKDFSSVKEENGKYLYVFADKINQVCKIGISVNPQKRLAAIQTGYPNKLEILFSVHLQNAQKVEQRLHEALDDFRLNGEWFYIDAYYLVDWSSLESFRFEQK